MRNLVIDIGNSRVKLGVFTQDRLSEVQTLDQWSPAEILSLATNHAVENVILSTVSSEPADGMAELRRRFAFHHFTAETPVPLRNAYQTPNSLGRDRLAAAVGAWLHYPASNCLVIDAGTCITLDVVTADGVFLGGNISPGIQMRLRAMHAFTKRLPLVETGKTDDLIGRNTETALRNGGQLGAALEIEALFCRLQVIYPDLRLIMTGGDAAILAENLKTQIFVQPHLVLHGLNKILQYNVERVA